MTLERRRSMGSSPLVGHHGRRHAARTGVRRHVSALLGRIQSVAETASELETLGMVAQISAELVDASDALVVCCDGQSWAQGVSGGRGEIDEVHGDRLGERSLLLLRQATEGSQPLMRELPHDELPETSLVPIEDPFELVPFLGVPMRVGGQSLGAVLLMRPAFAGQFTPDDAAIVNAIASQAAIALQHQLLMADAQRRSDRAESLRRDAEQIQREQAEFLAVISHDIKAPLSAIYGFAETLIARRDILSDTDQDAILHVVSGQSQRANRLVDALLELARVEAGALNLPQHPVSLRAVVESAVEAVADEPVQVHDSLGANDAVICGDAQRIEQVVVNLLMNALRYGAAPFEVHLSREAGIDGTAGAFAVIDVVDHGAGVPMATRQHLFQRFCPVAHHVGLGLAIVRAFSEAHGGTVDYVDTVPSGATFRVRLPLAQ